MRLSDEDLLRFRVEDPMSGYGANGGFSITGGHHRMNEIIRRVQAGGLAAIPLWEFSSMTDINDLASAFDRMELPTHDPNWSSWVLEQLYETTLGNHQATITDLFRGFDLALKRDDVDLTESVANLIKDVVVMGFTKYKRSYAQSDWGWANNELARGVSPARAYLFFMPCRRIRPLPLRCCPSSVVWKEARDSTRPSPRSPKTSSGPPSGGNSKGGERTAWESRPRTSYMPSSRPGTGFEGGD